ncbi:MAG: toll/interleukin-1 receptor domain-containing protein [Propionivibrio sp.]|nr:toll/interleukin-1 receptor domain-containing protein [Propionivibrio sp.]
MPGIFINYRRDDQAGFAGRLADVLENAFGVENVFRDVEDIHPGEDFVVAIQKQLSSVSVMLVMIGPAWLTVNNNGVRRLNETDDFVRREIQAALESGKPVLPVLVGGALMPEKADLPNEISALALRQAFVLSDASWDSDVARLVEFIRPLLPAQRRSQLRRVVAWGLATVIVFSMLLIPNLKETPRNPSPLPTSPSPEQTDSRLTGHWTARVRYGWGAEHDEIFELRLENGEMHGTASFLSLARIIEQGQLRGNQLSFVTHSQEVMNGSALREQTHRYRGQLKSGELHLVLETTGGLSTHSPVEFTARRTLE